MLHKCSFAVTYKSTPFYQRPKVHFIYHLFTQLDLKNSLSLGSQSNHFTSRFFHEISYSRSFMYILNEIGRDNHGVINPKALKDAIAKNAKQFSGHGQQVG